LRVESYEYSDGISKLKSCGNDTFSDLGDNDTHMALAAGGLVDDSVFGNWTTWNRRGQSGNVGHTATQNTFWNVRSLKKGTCRSKESGNIHSYQYGWGYIIGTENSRVCETIAETLGSHHEDTQPYDHVEYEDNGNSLSVKSLYEDQLARRMGKCR